MPVILFLVALFLIGLTIWLEHRYGTDAASWGAIVLFTYVLILMVSLTVGVLA